MFSIGATSLDYMTCINGFSVDFRVERVNDATLFAECSAVVTVVQVRDSGDICIADTCTA
jgi:hypothetical protein